MDENAEETGPGENGADGLSRPDAPLDAEDQADADAAEDEDDGDGDDGDGDGDANGHVVTMSHR